MNSENDAGTGLSGSAPDILATPARKTPGVGRSIVMLFAFLAIVFGCSAAGGIITTANLENWYVDIAKPDYTPANWVFPIVWNFLFFLMGLSGWMVWRSAGSFNAAGGALSLFGAQLMLNFAWSVLFFGLHQIGLAIFEAAALSLVVATTIWAFWKINQIAALLMVPYLAWSLFATWLTTAIWLLNR